MMFQVSITVSGSGHSHDYGDPVASLDDALMVVAQMEDAFVAWEHSGFVDTMADGEGVPDAIREYEGCDVYATSAAGEMFALNEDNQWEKVVAS